MFSLKEVNSLFGALIPTPSKTTLDFINELVKKADRGDKTSAYELFKVAKGAAPSYISPSFASISIGTGENGVVTLTSDTKWAVGNDLTLEVVLAGTPNTALSASLVDNDITLTLGTDAGGLADATKNTATLIEGIINGIAEKTFTALASGTGADAISTTLTKTNFSGGVDEVLTNERKAYNIANDKVASLFV